MTLKKLLSVSLLLIMTMWSGSLIAQSGGQSSLELYGNVRYALVGNGTDESGLEDPASFLRTRIGLRYFINESHSIHGRLATTFTDEFEEARFTIQSDGRGLSRGSISFDEFYYQYKNESFTLKAGRFQKSIPVLSNAKRSHIRFMSNHINIHWGDGLYLKKNLDNGWFGEFIGEYQPKDHVTYAYRPPLNFGDNDHNFTGYFGLENQSRDDLNIIQKGIGFFYAPGAFNKPGGYGDYFAFSSRLVFDFPAAELLNGGSFRVAGELGQNLNTAFEDGTNMVISAGINGLADRHQFMVEFAKTDSDWLLATVYGPNADEIEFRYRFFATSKLNFDARYRVRQSRVDGAAPVYNTFLRATYSF